MQSGYRPGAGALWMATAMLLMGAGEPTVEVHKVDDSTAIEGLLAGTMEASFAQVVHVLCDYDHYADFANTTEKQVVVSDTRAEELRRELPDDPDDVAETLTPGTEASLCPRGSNWVVSIQDFPFPVADAWMLVRYDAKLTADTFTIDYEAVAGTAKDTSGQWLVTRGPDGRAVLRHEYTFDNGMRLPEFLIRMAAGNQLPDMFEGIERKAQAVTDPSLPEPVTAPATATAPAPAPATAPAPDGGP